MKIERERKENLLSFSFEFGLFNRNKLYAGHKRASLVPLYIIYKC